MTSFSVIIPTRGRHRLLREAVASVLQQSHPARDIIVVDDGTGAAEAVAGLSRRVRVLDNGQRGPVAARNFGVSVASADVIAFLDDDDRWIDRDYLATAARFFAGGAQFCFADGIMAFDDGRPDLPFAFHADAGTLARDNTILISAVSYRRSLHDSLGQFDETLPFYWDWDWYLRVARAGHALLRIASPVVAIRVHAGNMSGDSLQALRRANLDLLAAKHGLPPVPLKNHVDIATGGPGIPASGRHSQTILKSLI